MENSELPPLPPWQPSLPKPSQPTVPLAPVGNAVPASAPSVHGFKIHRSREKRWRTVALLEAAVIVSALVVEAIFLIQAPTSSPDLLQLSRSHGLDLATGSQTAVSLTTGDSSMIDEFVSVLSDLKFPATIGDRIYATRSLDGTLVAESDEATLQWSYGGGASGQFFFDLEQS